jgi:integrase
MAGLPWKRVNTGSGVLVVDAECIPPAAAIREQHYGGEFGSLKKSSRYRNVPLPDEVISDLEQIRAVSQFTGPDDLVFCVAGGGPVCDNNERADDLKPVGRALGIPWLSSHVFRRTHPTFGDQVGMVMADRQCQIGRSNARMTMHYTQADVERRREKVNEMSKQVRQVEVLAPNGTEQSRICA